MIQYIMCIYFFIMNITNIYSSDILIIGAGQSGIVTTHYLSQNRDNNIWLIEKNDRLGGTWNIDNHYPNLVANNARDTFTLPDLQALPNTGDFPTINETYSYLTQYVKKYKLREYIYYNTVVSKVSHRRTHEAPFGYKYLIEFENNPYSLPIIYDFVVFATGYTHIPNIPFIHGSNEFNGQIIHTSMITKRLKNGVNEKNIVILGGGKSSFDAAIWAIKNRAKTVNIVLRHMHWGIPKYIGGKTPYEGEWNQNVIYSRISQMFLPTCLSCNNAIKDIPISTWFLHNTTIGKMIRNYFWERISKQIIEQYSIPKWLIPPRTLYEDGLYLSVLHPELYSLIKTNKIHIHLCKKISKVDKYNVYINDISNCSIPNGVPYSNSSLQADIIITGTGFKSSINDILDSDIHRNLFNSYGQVQLFRSTYNPNLPGIGFVGFKHNSNTMLSAALAARWISEYVRGQSGRISINVVLQNMDEVWRQIEDGNRFEREFSSIHDSYKKENSHGRGGLYTGNSIYPYADAILRDLGINYYRSNNWIKEFSDPQINTLYSGMDKIMEYSSINHVEL